MLRFPKKALGSHADAESWQVKVPGGHDLNREGLQAQGLRRRARYCWDQGGLPQRSCKEKLKAPTEINPR